MLQATAQELFVIDPISPASQLPAEDTNHLLKHQHIHDDDKHLEVVEEPHHMHDDKEQLEVGEPMEVEIVVEEIPGAPAGSLAPEPMLEVSEEPLKVEEKQEDTNDAKKSKKNEKWDWEKHGPHGFVVWIKSRLDDVPKHSGQDSAGLQRASAYLEKLDNEISKAMRMDLDGELDANKVEEIRSKLDDGLSRLNERLEKVLKAKKSNRKKKSDVEDDENGFVKEAQKIAGVGAPIITVPYLISVLARNCINAMVSSGHSLEHTYKNAVEKHKLSDREQYELQWLLWDMGLYIRGDRGFVPGQETHDLSSSDNFDFNGNFSG